MAEPTPFLAQSLKDKGYTGVTGSTPYKPATPEQTATLQNIYNDKSVTTVPRTVSPTAISLNVNFDGTHNNGLYPATGESATNIFELSKLQGKAPGANPDNTIYLPGVGAQTVPSDTLHPASGNPSLDASPSNLTALPINAGPAAINIVNDAYFKLETRITAILAENPNAEIAINLAGFSRGGAEAVAFANMLNERGIGPIKPGDVRIANMVLVDPVDQTNGALNVKPPTNVDNTLVMVATGEARSIMPSMVVSDDARIIAIPVAHSGLGGSYNPQGTSAVALAKMAEFLVAGGSPVADIPPGLQPDWEQMFIHNSSITPYGVPKLGGSQTWDTDEPNRRYEGADRSAPSIQDALKNQPSYSSIPTDDNGTAAYTATFADGRIVTKLTENGKLTETQVVVPQGAGIVTTTYDAKGKVTSTTSKTTDDEGNTLFVTTKPDGTTVTKLLDANQNVIDSKPDQATSEATPTPTFTPLTQTADLPPNQVLTLADSGNGTQTDGGNTTGYGNDLENGLNTDAATNTPVAGVSIASPATNNVANSADSVAPTTPVSISTLNPWQNQTVNDALTASGLNLDANNPITALPPVGGMAILANSEGDIVGSIDTSAANTTGFTTVSLLGQPVKMVDALGFSHDPADVAAANNAAGALGLANTLIGLENWDNASDFSRVQTVVTLYNQVNNLAGLGMPNMGGLGAGLGFIGAVQNGDFGGMVVGAIGVGNAIGSAMDMGAMAVSEAIGAALGMSAVNVIPGLNLIFALTNIEENPLGVVIAALALIPVYGQIIAVVLSICQALFTPAPVSEGEAHATFDDAGNIIVTTDSEKNGGGSTANHWMTKLAIGAQHSKYAVKDVIYYEFNSCLGNKYAGYSLKTPSKYGLTNVNAANDDVWEIAA